MRSHTALWFHVDMDAFFAAVEQRDHPEYRGKPVIVGAKPGERGVVSTCSYEARRFGVHSAMPVSQAYRLCPDGIYVHPRMKEYSKASHEIMKIFSDFSPEVIQVSIDEAFINMTGTQGIFGPPEEAAQRLKKQVFDTSGLTITVGAATNRLVAKMASAYRKPDGLTIIPPGGEQEFISSLRISDLWGVGKKTRQKLEDLNIRDIGQIVQIPRQTLQNLLGKSGGEYMFQIVRGIDPGIYDREVKSHSISNEHTFGADCRDPQVIEDTLFTLAHGIIFRLHAEGGKSRTLVLKLRLADFSTSTIQRRSAREIITVEDCYRIALDLLKQKWDSRTPVRLIGLGFASVGSQDDFTQTELFETGEEKRSRAEQAVLELKTKYDSLNISKARTLIDSRRRKEPGKKQPPGRDQNPFGE
ncbi:DNA polymerase IV [Salinispira pacifica]|uniref:DNA polymerase IV n=1 Tax=Salinispira pacifica TaxID=1307761 RepID=V5WH78_9SPIO|nr:DNA polymerase IV [Salinispira pacifica]AHC14980.1 DNA polymerase IV [Salinispira pacifica]